MSEANGFTIEVEGLRAGYGSLDVIRGLSFSFKGPGLLQVIGPNGAGKTTLLKVLAGVIDAREGRVRIAGLGPREAAARGLVGYVPQESARQLSAYPVTVLEVVFSGLIARRGVTREEGRRITLSTLRALGVDAELYSKRFGELSSGLKQRVLLARSLAMNPPVLLLDEPLANVDPHGRLAIAKIVASLASSKTVVITSHDPEMLLESSNAILALGLGAYAYGRPSEVLRREVLEKIYGVSVSVYGSHTHIFDEGCCRW